MNQNRDLMVLFRNGQVSEDLLERQVSQLHSLLFAVERSHAFYQPHELLDLNKYKILKGKIHISQFISLTREKPFVFLNCCN